MRHIAAGARPGNVATPSSCWTLFLRSARLASLHPYGPRRRTHPPQNQGIPPCPAPASRHAPPRSAPPAPRRVAATAPGPLGRAWLPVRRLVRRAERRGAPTPSRPWRQVVWPERPTGERARNTDRTRSAPDSSRSRSRAGRRRGRGDRHPDAARGAAGALRKTNRTRSPRKSWRNRTRTSRGCREGPHARRAASARSDAKMRHDAARMRRPRVTAGEQLQLGRRATSPAAARSSGRCR